MIITLQSAPRMTLVTLRIGKASASGAPVAVAQTVPNPYALLSVLGVTAGSGGGSGSGSGLMTLDMSNGLSPFLM